MSSKKIWPRLLSNKIKKSTKSVLLIGPRQTGKSTLIKNLNPDLFINFANEKDFLRFNSDPDLLENLLAAQKYKKVFIDEIQRIPKILNTIQHIIDNSRNAPKFFLTGSSARKLKRGQANLLPGRLFSYEISGFSAKEFDFRLNVEKALKYGTLPENYLLNSVDDIEKNLEMYAANYLTEEIKAEALTRNIDGFARFINECAARNSQIIDYTKIAQQTKVSRTSIIRFFELLEDTLIGQRLNCYEIDGIDTLKHPKFYFFDVGVVNGLLNNYLASKDRIGVLFEALVYSQIRNTTLSLDKKVQIFYFRTRHGLEVDFVIVFGNKKIAIEVKSGSVNSEDTASLELLKKYDNTIDQLFCVSLTEKTSRKIKNVFVCNLNEFLRITFK